MLNVCGLDLSLTSTGWSCGDQRSTVSSKKSGEQRLIEIRNSIVEILTSLEFPGVVLEGYSFASRNSQSHSIGELGGVVKVSLVELGVPFVVVPPTSRAKFATGRGNASKNEVVSSVSARTGIVWAGKGADDMCDAFVLEEMGRAACGAPRFSWPEVNMSALDKIDWTHLEGHCAKK